jgi:ABC-type uncharacterized transport system involved in gliding motility auxiliary subunit
MKRAAKLRLWLRRHNRVFLLLLLSASGISGFLSQHYHWQMDLTQNTRHSLSPASHKILREMHGVVSVTAYATPPDSQHGDLRQPIRDFVARYQAIKPDLKLKIIDPALEPLSAREAGVHVNGELVLAYRGRSEHLTTLNEHDFTNTLMRLARSRERLVMALGGHGERKFDGDARHDLGEFGRQLSHKGFRTETLRLALAPEVPDNTSVLVLTQPATDILGGEVDKIKRYLARGGNLLWLVEPAPLRGLQAVEEALSLNLTPGIVIDPAGRELGLPPATTVATQYGQHPVTTQFDLFTVFPRARAVGVNDDPVWRATPLIEAAPRGWLEHGMADGNAAFDPKHDIAGPVVIGLALEKSHEDNRQRVAVIGSGEFLSNAYLGFGGNLDLGINLINWLAGDDNLITIQPKTTVDATLNLNKSAAMALAAGFLVVLPLSFFGIATLVWRRRRDS